MSPEKDDGSVRVRKGLKEEQVVPMTPAIVDPTPIGFPWPQGKTWDTEGDKGPFWVSKVAAGNTDIILDNFELTAVIIHAWIYNRTGSDQTYDFQIFNNTTGEVLKEFTGLEVPQKGTKTYVTLAGTDKVSSGDMIVFYITKGVVGTGSDQLILGGCALQLTYLVKASGIENYKGVQSLEV